MNWQRTLKTLKKAEREHLRFVLNGAPATKRNCQERLTEMLAAQRKLEPNKTLCLECLALNNKLFANQ